MSTSNSWKWLNCRRRRLTQLSLVCWQAPAITAGLLWISVIGSTVASLQTVEYCSSDTLVLRCWELETVILVQRAQYGRMSAGKCITSTYGESMGCRADVLSQLDERCSGRPNCSMLVAVFDSLIQPCPRDFKSYLEITYDCVRVSYLGDCSSSHSAAAAAAADTTLTPHHGYLALYQRPSAGNDRWKNRRSCVWSLRAEPGQQISVSWRLPSGGSDGQQSRLRRPVGPCPATIVFVDGDDRGASGQRSEVAADGQGRTGGVGSLHATTCSVGSRSEPRLIYTSKTNELQVRPTDALMTRLLPLSHTDWKPYLIEYRTEKVERSKAPSSSTASKSGAGSTFSSNLVLAASIGIALGSVTGALMMVALLVVKRNFLHDEMTTMPSCSVINHNRRRDVEMVGLRRRMTGSGPCCCVPWSSSSPPESADSAALYEYTYAQRIIGGADLPDKRLRRSPRRFIRDHPTLPPLLPPPPTRDRHADPPSTEDLSWMRLGNITHDVYVERCPHAAIQYPSSSTRHLLMPATTSLRDFEPAVHTLMSTDSEQPGPTSSSTATELQLCRPADTQHDCGIVS